MLDKTKRLFLSSIATCLQNKSPLVQELSDGEKNDREEIFDRMAKIKTSYSLYSLLNPIAVRSLNEELFSDPVFTDFFLDLAHIFKLQCVLSASDDVDYFRISSWVIETLTSIITKTSSDRKDGIEPILTSHMVNNIAASETVARNPWLITVAMLIITDISNLS